MISDATMAKIGAVSGFLSAVFTGGILYVTHEQHSAQEEEVQRKLSRIEFVAYIDKNPDDVNGGTLNVSQISGDPTILHGVRLRASIESETGKHLSAKPFDLPLEGGIIENGMPKFVVEDIGAQICHRRRQFGNIRCDPSLEFEVLYQIDIEGQLGERNFNEALYRSG